MVWTKKQGIWPTQSRDPIWSKHQMWSFHTQIKLLPGGKHVTVSLCMDRVGTGAATNQKYQHQLPAASGPIFSRYGWATAPRKTPARVWTWSFVHWPMGNQDHQHPSALRLDHCQMAPPLHPASPNQITVLTRLLVFGAWAMGFIDFNFLHPTDPTQSPLAWD